MAWYDIYGNSLSNIYDILGNLISAKEIKTFSVLSDSYGAYDGTISTGNAYYYPANNNDVTDSNQMWWSLLAESMGSTLLVNNSFSGSRIADDPDWYAGKENSFIGRSDNLVDCKLIS